MDFSLINFVGTWNAGTTYAQNDAVFVAEIGYFISVYDGNKGNIPNAIPEIWLFIHGVIPDNPVNQTISAYSEVVTYKWGEAVTVAENTYISMVYKNLNNLVSDVDFWRLLPEYEVLPACGAEYVGVWNAKQEYLIDQVVIHEGNYYTAYQQTINQEPGTVQDIIWKACSGLPTAPTATTSLVYDESIQFETGENVVSIDGFRAIATRPSQGADITDTRYFQPASNSASFNLDDVVLTYAGAGLKGKVYNVNDSQFLALQDTNDDPKEGSESWKKVGASDALPTAVFPVLSGRTIATKPEGIFIGERSIVTNFYMKFRNHVYHWKSNDQWRLHNKGTAQTVDGAAVDFLLTFYISYKGLRKIIDFIHIITNTNSAFNNVDFESNFVSSQSVLGSLTDRYRIKEGELRVAARELNSTKRVRGNWIKVTIERKKTQSLVSFNITTVKSKSRNSH